jgi:DNA-directed RNA polymerase specialized sigma24 family protein
VAEGEDERVRVPVGEREDTDAEPSADPSAESLAETTATAQDAGDVAAVAGSEDRYPEGFDGGYGDPGAEHPDAAPAGTQVMAGTPRRSTLPAADRRADFGAHLEANYQRLVAQLYAITLDAGEAHDAVQDAYSRAWRGWATIGRSPDPAAWVRRVAVRSTVRSWRRTLARIGIGRAKPVGDGVDPRTRAMLDALGRLTPGERRAVVLFHMGGSPMEEIAAVERVSVGIVKARLARARQVVTEGMADVLPAVLADVIGEGYDGYAAADIDDYDPGAPVDGYSSSGYAAGGYGTGGYALDPYDGSGGWQAGDYSYGYGPDGDHGGKSR